MGNPGQPCSTLREGGYSLPGQEHRGSVETQASPEPRAPELARAPASLCQHVPPAWISCLELFCHLRTEAPLQQSVSTWTFRSTNPPHAELCCPQAAANL